MKYDDMPTYGNDAYENDWLEVKFTQTKKLEDIKEKKEGVFAKFAGKVKSKFAKRQFDNPQDEAQYYAEKYHPVVERKQKEQNVFLRAVKKSWKPVAACAAVCLLLVGMRFVDNGFVGDVFGYAKDTFTSSVVSTDGDDTQSKNTMSIPSNATVSVVDGDVTLTGGSVAVNFLEGVVTDVTETSVTVSVDEGFDIVYSNLNEVMVAKDDILSQYHVVGKYDKNAVVNLVQDGQKVTNVSADGYTLAW